jgi:hypothetical protein
MKQVELGIAMVKKVGKEVAPEHFANIFTELLHETFPRRLIWSKGRQALRT